MTVSDTHADTTEAALVVEEALRKGKSYVTPGGLKHWPALDAFRDYRRALVAECDRERARGDRAEALDRAAYYYRRELREIIQDCGHDKPDIRKIRERAETAIRAADHELAALSAGSGGRETT